MLATLLLAAAAAVPTTHPLDEASTALLPTTLLTHATQAEQVLDRLNDRLEDAGRSAPDYYSRSRAAEPPTSSFTMYSPPFELRYGEVHMRLFNRMNNASSHHGFSQREQDAGQDLPEDVVSRYASGERTMAVVRLDLDIVRRDGDTDTLVPMYDIYNHHSLVSFPDREGSGGEVFDCRRPTEEYEAPYVVPLQTPSQVMVFSHLIGLKAPGVDFSGVPSPLAECPCTANVTRRFNLTDDTIDGRECEHVVPVPGLASYKGGSCCCVDGERVIDDVPPAEEERPSYAPAQMRLTVRYADVTQDARPLTAMENCEFTRGEQRHRHGEITIPSCAAGTPDSECTYTWEYEAVFAVHADCLEMAQQASSPRTAGAERTTIHAAQSHEGERVRELAYLKPHLHEGGISIAVIDALSNRTLCSASRDDGGVVYGRGRDPGDEEGYLTSMRPCTWGPDTAPRLARLHPLRLVAVYEARRTHYGVMSGISARAHTPA